MRTPRLRIPIACGLIFLSHRLQIEIDRNEFVVEKKSMMNVLIYRLQHRVPQQMRSLPQTIEKSTIRFFSSSDIDKS